ncbi:MAG: alpha/beta fold hydrolase [Gammaproteobacteria bacterium]|nr:alpha/beta fold hydrolase [Gammaproteobacteria bacterium]
MLLYAKHYGDIAKPHTSNAIIILHGLFGNYRNWQPIARSLATHYPVYSLDLRNHGQSTHDGVMDYPTMAEDVLRFIQDKKLNSVTIIAHSMGGKVAMTLALAHPQVVNKLVVVDIAPISYQHDFSEVLNAFQAVPLNKIQSRQEADRYLSTIISDKNLRQFLLQNLKQQDGQYYWRLNLEAIRQSIETIIAFPNTSHYPPFKKRVLFIGGGQSDYLSKENQQKAKILFPRASFSIIKSAGHWLHTEQAELFKVLIQPYLKS